MFIETTITWVPSGFSGYILWLDIKLRLKQYVAYKTAILGTSNRRPAQHLSTRHLHLLNETRNNTLYSTIQ